MGREVVKVARGLLVGRWLKQSHYGSVESEKNNKRMLRRKIPPFSLCVVFGLSVNHCRCRRGMNKMKNEQGNEKEQQRKVSNVGPKI